MQPVISLLLPTRGRVKLVERLFASVIATTVNLEQIEFILYLDADDVMSHSLANQKLKIKKIIGERMSMGAYNSECLKHAVGDIIILVNDDVVFRTQAWDEQVVAIDNKFPDKIYLAFANDLFKKRWCSFPILSRRTCELLEEPYPKSYKGAFIDTHLYDIFKRLQKVGVDRICYLEDVVFEHLHYRVGKAEFDEVYKKRERFADDAAFVELATLRQASAELLYAAIHGQVNTMLKVVDLGQKYSVKGTFLSLLHITKSFLFSRNLPLRWRFFLWYWFLGRHLASKGFLWPLFKV